MSYKKRVIIFISSMAVIFVAMAVLYITRAKNNLNNLSNVEIVPGEAKDAKDKIKSTFDNLFEIVE
ncbi:MAG: hypothetical protein R3251_02810 [Candidatus Spechtbacterales bacterium]|nr:hypothetical protein [Candidatus Spechtbacterales bacterium]